MDIETMASRVMLFVPLTKPGSEDMSKLLPAVDLVHVQQYLHTLGYQNTRKEYLRLKSRTITRDHRSPMSTESMQPCEVLASMLAPSIRLLVQSATTDFRCNFGHDRYSRGGL